jgi:hypothetical protein
MMVCSKLLSSTVIYECMFLMSLVLIGCDHRASLRACVSRARKASSLDAGIGTGYDKICRNPVW